MPPCTLGNLGVRDGLKRLHPSNSSSKCRSNYMFILLQQTLISAHNWTQVYWVAAASSLELLHALSLSCSDGVWAVVVCSVCVFVFLRVHSGSQCIYSLCACFCFYVSALNSHLQVCCGCICVVPHMFTWLFLCFYASDVLTRTEYKSPRQ